ncbi:MAG TPA: hypothetical protein VFO19_13790, partial [Vicinamibacterales bacterium]|nr:hypothetical protein [Vicinamibacterales bacterium]
WMAAQDRDEAGARRWWTRGIAIAERALQRPWDEFLIDRREPALFGLREATLVVDLASRCAAGLHLLPHAAERPGIVAAQLFESPVENVARLTARLRAADARADFLEKEASFFKQRFRAQLLLEYHDVKPPADLRFAIFGAGAAGRRALELLRARGAVVDCFADNDARQHGHAIGGLPIVAPDCLPQRGVDVIAVTSQSGRLAIFGQLERMGYEIGRHVASIDGLH